MAATRKMLTLPIYCSNCGQAVTIEYMPYATRHELKASTWACPHPGCTGKHYLTLPGELIDRWPGHVPHPTAEPVH